MKVEKTYLILPGYGNSDEGHWQTYFEKQLPNCHRVLQMSWDKPICSDWINAINEAVKQFDPETVVLISHSMGGIAIAQWAKYFDAKVKGAFIVAPPDLENPYLDLSLESFIPIPTSKLPFPSLVIASSNDNWATVKRSQYFAKNWGSKLIAIGDAGHINTTSGYGSWDVGLGFLRKFVDEISR
ncbi:MAG: alpha/beta fold hydrolase [Bacteroidetes bacterium]|nr:alpha/beta fold hydrolase [Bacteroidota bacterium]